jgi:hypothetical protein
MGRSIPPEWTVNLLALGKEPWKFRYVNDQLATYHQQWKSDQQNQIMINMAGKFTINSSDSKSSDGKRKNNERNNHNIGGDRSGRRQENNGH